MKLLTSLGAEGYQSEQKLRETVKVKHTDALGVMVEQWLAVSPHNEVQIPA